MIYFTKEDFLARIKASNLETITEGDDSLLTDHELDAVHEVSSYLAHNYDTGAIFMPLETPDFKLNPTIKRMTIDIALYNLHNSRVNPRNIPENIVQKRDDAIKWLRDVANPRTQTVADFLPKREFGERRNNAISWGSKEKRQNSY